MSYVKIGRTDSECFNAYWPIVSKHIQSYGQEWLKTEDLDNIGQRLAKGELDLWIMAEPDGHLLALGICTWSKRPKHSAYYILWCGGHRVAEFLEEGLSMCEKYACFMGADEVRLEGRKGWLRALAPFGYVPVVQMKKSVKVLWKR